MSLRDLENETAETLLHSIKKAAEDTDVSGKLLDLAYAYAAVVNNAPPPRAAAPTRIR